MKNDGSYVARDMCFICNDIKQLLLHKQMRDISKHDNMVHNKEPCERCKALMKQGVILISCDEEKTTDEQNPYRSGGWLVVKDEAVMRMPIQDDMKASLLKHRVGFLTDEAWQTLGLSEADANWQAEHNKKKEGG